MRRISCGNYVFFFADTERVAEMDCNVNNEAPAQRIKPYLQLGVIFSAPSCKRPRGASLGAVASVVVLCYGCDMANPEAGSAESRQGRGATISVQLVDKLDVPELVAQISGLSLGFNIHHPIVTYSIVYETVDASGDTTLASGAISMPQGAIASLPVVSYQHGTITRRLDAPSSSPSGRLIGQIFAATGYFTIMPDYLGLGISPGLHPYVHASTSATAIVDMLRASVDFASANEISLARKLFLLGYSQGGYTTMAAHRALEAEYSEEFTVTASAPMAGPYDLSETMSYEILSDRPIPEPYYLPYVLLSYNAVYEIYESPSEFLRSPYDTTLPPLFDGTHSSHTINAALPDVPRQILQPNMLVSFETNPDDMFRRLLRENDVFDWAPVAPVRLFHCEGDDTVPKENSEIARDHLANNGATVFLVDPLPAANHILCAAPSLLLAKRWFDTL